MLPATDSAGSLDPIRGFEDLTKAAHQSFSNTLRALGELSGYLPGGQLSWQLPGIPKHLTGMLGGGLIGAGIGGGLGYLGSRLLPRTWDRKRLTRTGAMLGGLAGMTTGLATLGFNAASGRSLGDDSLVQLPPRDRERYLPTLPHDEYTSHLNPLPTEPSWTTTHTQVPNPKYDPNMPYALPSDYRRIMKEGGLSDDNFDPVIKQALSETGYEVVPLKVPVTG